MKTAQTDKIRKNGGKTEQYQESPGGNFKDGNPGKPVGTTNFSTDFERVIRLIAKDKKITPEQAMDALHKVGYSKAKGGNFQFYKDAFDRYYGKAQENIDMTTKGKELPAPIYGGKSVKVSGHDGDEKDIPTE